MGTSNACHFNIEGGLIHCCNCHCNLLVTYIVGIEPDVINKNMLKSR